ncbi:IclR family transcriptional regulator C-terminal domain-containing protein [Streptomyces sp. NPDC096934]|uniref:IclR family transcriptional regulator domain-containing protein n=1 Tax=Streptomyces sp. NPDC096934 TaxID=3155551 RepID=UPI0033191E77
MVVHLTVLDGPDVVDLDKVGGRFAAAIPSRVGGHAPAHCTAGGKAILAWIAPERVDALFGSVLSRRIFLQSEEKVEAYYRRGF